MDAKLLYWTGALVNMAVMFGFLVVGVRAIRAGEVAKHRRSMLTAGALVIAFLISFLLKSYVIGFEDFTLWSRLAVTNLRVHESFVSLMILAASVALVQAWRMRETRNVTKDREHPMAPDGTVKWHRRAGWTAVVAGAFGLLTAAFVLIGMLQRAA
jgi:uncharacterized membrane protein YozB (DUF420 family)